jgi:sugar fermentation stimulation protein A
MPDFPSPLQPATLLQRYKRVLADVQFDDGAIATAHVPNTGAMLGVSKPGSRVWLSPAPAGSKRKLAWTLHLVEADGGLVGVDTSLPNRLVAESLAAGALAPFAAYKSIRAEVAYAKASRVDFLLDGGDRPVCFLEVKNVHMRRTGRLAEFPDCKAERSARHMHDLAEQIARGARAAAVFVVQRMDCDAFCPADDLDPGFAAAFNSARAAGVEIHAWDCDIGITGVRLRRPIRVLADRPV